MVMSKTDLERKRRLQSGNLTKKEEDNIKILAGVAGILAGDKIMEGVEKFISFKERITASVSNINTMRMNDILAAYELKHRIVLGNLEEEAQRHNVKFIEDNVFHQNRINALTEFRMTVDNIIASQQIGLNAFRIDTLKWLRENTDLKNLTTSMYLMHQLYNGNLTAEFQADIKEAMSRKVDAETEETKARAEEIFAKAEKMRQEAGEAREKKRQAKYQTDNDGLNSEKNKEDYANRFKSHNKGGFSGD